MEYHELSIEGTSFNNQSKRHSIFQKLIKNHNKILSLINMKDFKPSRLSAVTTMLKYYFKQAKSKTSVIKFALGIVEQQSCKIKSFFTYDLNILNNELDSLKINQ